MTMPFTKFYQSQAKAMLRQVTERVTEAESSLVFGQA